MSKSGNFSQVLIFRINFTENEDNVVNDIDDDNGEVGFSCADLDGIICSAGETCDGDTIRTKDANAEVSCCLGICQESTNTSNPFWGYIIIAVLSVLVLFVIIKYRKTKSESNPMKKYYGS